MKILIISGGSIDEMWGRKWVADYEPDYCIAADSGLVMADKLGLTVDLLLGDYDSVDKKIFEKYNGNTKTITYPCEKDYTDTHLALKKAIEKIKKLQDTSKDSTEDEIAIIGATGTRYDHAFTNIFVLDESLEAGIRCAIYDKNNKLYPLGAIYSKNVLPIIEEMIEKKYYKLSYLIEKSNFVKINIEDTDIELETLSNINTPQEYDSLKNKI